MRAADLANARADERERQRRHRARKTEKQGRDPPVSLTGFAAQVVDAVEEIVEEVAHFYNLHADTLRGRGRSKKVARPRQVAMYLARKETQASLPQIGQALSRDHTTVLYGCEKISQQIEEDNNLRRDVLAIRERLYNDQG